MTDHIEPDLTDPEPPRPPAHRVHPPEIWERARDDYLAGLSGPAVCARYGLGLAAFRKRAAAGGWRRIDQPAGILSGPLEIEGDIDDAGYFDLAEMSTIHLRAAVVNGCVGQAEAWLRLHLRLHEASNQEFARLQELGACEFEQVDEVDEVDGGLPAAESTLTPGTRPLPETPSPPPSSPGPAPGCDGERGQTGL